ncbi:DUF6701 domain-containing protein [Thiohalomonas denitrificans]|uniref:NPCBM-associated, NEW3 domain of alpha-galactosidase n=1 Tax=Thiohalomonas denitrificans TaxID=415747 RepID=A0A1G5QV59_9GAMM|nr:DUF6701 domain-containing protein [Thiohalomonas denitrificans]SCZ65161.1 NPCBM-associated, NEW3 domain of alpha-galactosidase [Thiohalomonas denitrificans]
MRSQQRIPNCWLWLLAVLVIPISLLTVPSAANAFGATQCAADRFEDDLNCTANDVSLTNIRVVGDQRSCVGGSTITLDLEATANFGNADRYDFGIFVANDGKNPRLLSTDPDGAASCSVSSLPTTSPFLDLDSDFCGDGGGDVGGGTGSGVVYLTNVELPCRTTPTAGGKLNISYVATWYQNSGEICTSSLDVVPGSKSKCSQQDEVSELVDVIVLPTISIDDGVDFVTSGDETDYTVVIQNLTGADLGGVVFKDPAVTGLTANSITCSATDGATCPSNPTVADLQGSGITLPTMPHEGTLTFTINATLSGNHNDSITNTASVTAGGQSGYASDTDTIVVGNIALSPATSSKTGAKGQPVTHTFTLYNFGAAQDISLTASSSQGWTTSLSPASISLSADGSATVTVTVDIPSNAVTGVLDTTTITAQAGGNTTTATAVTTVAERLTFTPDNTSAGGKGASVYYSHRVQNNWSNSLSVSFSSAFSGQCTDWTADLYEIDNETPLTVPVELDPLGGYRDVVVKVTIPTGAVEDDECVVTTTASASANSAEVTDTTKVKSLVLYSDPGHTEESYIYPAGNEVYGKSFGLIPGSYYFFVWKEPDGTVQRTSPETLILDDGRFPDTFAVPQGGPLGKWTVEVFECTDGSTCNTTQSFSYTNFYVGPDHLQASYSGLNPTLGSEVVVDLALHDKWNHVVPMVGGNLVKGDASTKDPLKLTVTVSGPATIVDDGTGRWSISGQTATGRLDDTTGTATITIRNDTAETVTVTPATYNSALYGSPERDEPATVSFERPPLHHIRIIHDGHGLTCQAEPVTIKACADSDCSFTFSDPVSVDLTSPGSGWEMDSVTFSGGITVVGLSHVTSGTASLDASVTSHIPVQSRRCFDTSGTETCDVQFVDTGIVIDGDAGDGDPESAMLTQITGKPSDEGHNAANQRVRVVRTDDRTGACITGVQNQTLSASVSYLVPVAAEGLEDNSMVIDAASSANLTAAGTSDTINLAFDNDGTAPFRFTSSDAGKYTLRIAMDIPLTDADGEPTGDTLAAADQSNTFIVRPLAVFADASGNPKAQDAEGGTFSKVGETFTLNLKPLRWAPGLDDDDDGEWDDCGNTDLADPGSGYPHVPAWLIGQPGADLEKPSTGTPGILTYGDGDIAFLAGTSEVSASAIAYGEAGIIRLRENGLNDFLEEPVHLCSPYIGRFTPDHFTVEDANLTDRCDTTGEQGFTYMDENLCVDFTLAARNMGGGLVDNYRDFGVGENFAKWDGSGAVRYDLPLGAAGPLFIVGAEANGADLSSRLAIESGSMVNSWLAGQADFLVKLSVTRTATADGPFDPFNLGLYMMDGDDIPLTGMDLTIASDTFKSVGNTAIRYGRAALKDATVAGTTSGTTAAVPIEFQYYDGTDFVINSDDVTTTVTHSAGSPAFSCSEPDSDTLTCTEVTITETTVSNGGEFTFTLDNDIDEEGGTLVYELDNAPNYLTFDWDGDGSLESSDKASASVTFAPPSYHHGDRRFIYWREQQR